MSLEVAVFLLAAAGFGVWGWLWWPNAEAPAKFRAQTYSAGISSVPDDLTVVEYHGPHPDNYYDPRSDFVGTRGDEPFDKNATPGTVTLDIAAAYSKPFAIATPVAVAFDIPANAQLQMCQGWSVDTPYMTAIPRDFRPTVERFAPNFHCEPEKYRDGPPMSFVGYGTMRDLADPEQRRLRIVATAPARTTGLRFQLRFTGIEGIGFSTTALGVESHFPQFVQVSTEETRPYWDPYSDAPSIADTRVHVRYWIANADQATWAGSTPRTNASQATWDYRAIDPPIDASAIFQNAARANSDKTFFVGLIVGLAGAALLSATQASFAHRRSFRTPH